MFVRSRIWKKTAWASKTLQNIYNTLNTCGKKEEKKRKKKAFFKSLIELKNILSFVVKRENKKTGDNTTKLIFCIDSNV